MYKKVSVGLRGFSSLWAAPSAQHQLTQVSGRPSAASFSTGAATSAAPTEARVEPIPPQSQEVPRDAASSVLRSASPLAANPAYASMYASPAAGGVSGAAASAGAASLGGSIAGSGVQHGYVRAPDRRRKASIDEMIRVDHAGEVGAVAIYEGQAWVLRGTPAAAEIERMRAGEVAHVETMERVMGERRVRPTLLLPLWRLAGYALGAGTAVLGPKAAMACTVAVETVIGQHYNDQIRELLAPPKPASSTGRSFSGSASDEDAGDAAPASPARLTPEDAALAKVFKQHRDDELEHLDTGMKWDAPAAPAYNVISQVIKVGCSAAISVARRI